LGCIQEGGRTTSPRSGPQTQTEALGGWQEGNYRRYEETVLGWALKRAEAAKTQSRVAKKPAPAKKVAVKKAAAKKTASKKTAPVAAQSAAETVGQ